MAIPLGRSLPTASRDLPEDLARKAPGVSDLTPILLCSLAPGGVCRAASVAGRAVRSYRTVSPLPTNGANPCGRRSVLCGTFPRLAPAGR